MLRTGWTPSVSFDSANDNLELAVQRLGRDRHCPNCRPMVSAVNGAKKDTVFSTTSTSTQTSIGGFTTSFSNLRYILRDPNLLDGFLPVQSVTINSVMRKPATTDATDRVDFVLKTHSGRVVP